MSNVKVYTTPTCPWCIKLKGFLDESKVEFEEIDVSESHEKAHELMEKTGQMSVPVTEIHGTLIVGYNKEALNQALKLILV